MKKLSILTGLFILAAGLASCAKEKKYVCECSITINGVSASAIQNYDYTEKHRADAEHDCAQNNHTETSNGVATTFVCALTDK